MIGPSKTTFPELSKLARGYLVSNWLSPPMQPATALLLAAWNNGPVHVVTHLEYAHQMGRYVAVAPVTAAWGAISVLVMTSIAPVCSTTRIIASKPIPC